MLVVVLLVIVILVVVLYDRCVFRRCRGLDGVLVSWIYELHAALIPSELSLLLFGWWNPTAAMPDKHTNRIECMQIN